MGIQFNNTKQYKPCGKSYIKLVTTNLKNLKNIPRIQMKEQSVKYVKL